MIDLRPITSKRTVIAAARADDVFKLCQIMFLRDGSLTVSFPYFHESPCLLAIGTMPPAAHVPKLRVGDNGKASSHKVKYTHHPDGRAHFSQDGLILTQVKRNAVPLDRADGHLFTLTVQGLTSFKKLSQSDRKPPTAARASLVFRTASQHADSLKILGRIFTRARFEGMLVNPKGTIGPVIPAPMPNGRLRQAVIVAANDHVERVLMVTVEPVGPQNEGRPSIVFVGGFDPPEVVYDHSATSDFLFMASPIKNLAEAAARLGSVDFRRE